MKKVVLFFAAVAAISLASCGGDASTGAPKAEDTTAAEEVAPVADTVPAAVADSLAKDSTIADSTVAPAADTVAAKAE